MMTNKKDELKISWFPVHTIKSRVFWKPSPWNEFPQSCGINDSKTCLRVSETAKPHEENSAIHCPRACGYDLNLKICECWLEVSHQQSHRALQVNSELNWGQPCQIFRSSQLPQRTTLALSALVLNSGFFLGSIWFSAKLLKLNIWLQAWYDTQKNKMRSRAVNMYPRSGTR